MIEPAEDAFEHYLAQALACTSLPISQAGSLATGLSAIKAKAVRCRLPGSSERLLLSSRLLYVSPIEILIDQSASSAVEDVDPKGRGFLLNELIPSPFACWSKALGVQPRGCERLDLWQGFDKAALEYLKKSLSGGTPLAQLRAVGLANALSMMPDHSGDATSAAAGCGLVRQRRGNSLLTRSGTLVFSLSGADDQ